jgi:heat shock protein HslJ
MASTGTARRARSAYAVAAACALLAACSTSSEEGEVPKASTTASPSARTSSPTTPAVSLAGTWWTLGSYRLASGVSVPAAKEPAAVLELAEGGAMSGATGCNRLAGTWKQVSADLTVLLGPVTQMACLSARLSQQERAVLDGLAGARSFRTGNEELTLLDAAGSPVLVYRTLPAALVGPQWRATAINNGSGGLETNAATSKVTAVFDDKGGGRGTVTGSAACNGYSGDYRTSGADGLTITSLGQTMKACAADLMQVEQQYLAALAKVTSYHVGADGLTLRDAGGATLVRYVVG